MTINFFFKMTELTQLIDKEIPDGRQSLQENFTNLERLAQYCQENYNKATDKRAALEETKNFTTHSLACVAYQINSLATNFLKLLDLQQNQMTEMESSVNHLAQTVQIHKEKVARREIGVLTTNRSITRPIGVKNGIIFPEHGERPTKYQRKNIDYSELDNIGHGVKSQSTASSTQKSRTPSMSSHGSHGSGNIPAPSQRPPSPPPAQQMKQQQQMSRQGSQQQPQGPYRTPAPMVAPPTVPGQYAAMPQQRVSGYAPGLPPPQGMTQMQQMPGGMNQTPVGMAHPISQTSAPPSPGIMMSMPDGGPPRFRASHMPQQTSIDLPPPPLTPADTEDRGSRSYNIDEASPPPPPPPQFNEDEEEPLPPMEEDPYAATGPDIFSTNWIPQEYLEKVVAIYDYQADKEDELSFSENSVIYVIKKNDDGWWEGVLNGQTGLFPGNYMEPCI